jgi:hypothetical protein
MSSACADFCVDHIKESKATFLHGACFLQYFQQEFETCGNDFNEFNIFAATPVSLDRGNSLCGRYILGL